MLRSVETHPAFLELFDAASVASLPWPAGGALCREGSRKAERGLRGFLPRLRPLGAQRRPRKPAIARRHACFAIQTQAGASRRCRTRRCRTRRGPKTSCSWPSSKGLPGAPRRSPRERAERPRPQAACGLPGSVAVALGCVLTSCLLQATVRLVLSGICLPGAIRSCHSGGGVP